jgi:hypothetical protein
MARPLMENIGELSLSALAQDMFSGSCVGRVGERTSGCPLPWFGPPLDGGGGSP